ncbi:MAG: SDR family NAD(P)-dependent oxidoreductase, partial [Bacteroidota bacterium]
MDLGLKGKIVVITGAAGRQGSIGATIVQKLADEGAIPVIIDIDARGFEYQQLLRDRGIDALFCQVDLTQPSEIDEAMKTITDKYQRIDVVINSVGVNDGVGFDASYEAFMHSLQLNMVSFFWVVKRALPYLKKSKGNILNIGSKVALTGQGGTSAYAAAKGGVLGLTREWAVELIKDGVRSNAIIIAECWTPAYQDWIDTLDDCEAKLQTI